MAARFIPRTPEDLTPEWLSQVLRERGVLTEARVVSARHEPLGAGEGFMGTLTRLHLELDRPEPGAPRTLIAKMPSVVRKNRVMGELLGAYEREILFYRELAANVPLRVPRVYYSDFDPDRGSQKQGEIIGTVDKMPLWLIKVVMPLSRWIVARKRRRYALLMEDLGAARVGDQVAGARPESCHAVLVALARAHAALWESPLLDGFFWLTRQDLQCRTRHSMYRESRKAFSDRYAALMDRGMDRIASWLDVHGEQVARNLHGGAPETLIHCDFRYDNLFFDDANADDPVVVIDWQLVGRGCGAYDVAYLLGGALPADVSREDELALLRAYHDELIANGVKDYDYERFTRDYERGLLTTLQTIATTDQVVVGEDRGADLIDLWVERLFARARHADLAALV